MFKKIISIFLSLGIASAVFSGCQSSSDPQKSSNNSAAKTSVNITAINGPTGIGMANLMADSEENKTQNDYHVSIISSPDEAVSKILSGEADIAAVPTNLAASLYHKTNQNIQMLAVNTEGVLYILENGSSAIKHMSDLKGKTIYSIGQGANPEYILKYLLSANGLDPERDVHLNFVSGPEELTTLMSTGKADIAMAPEPAASVIQSKTPEVHTALDLNAEWATATQKQSSLLMGGIIANKSFIENHKDTIQTFLEEYRKSIENANADVQKTAGLCQKYQIIENEAIAKKAIPKCNLVYMDGAYMKNQIQGYLQVLYDANPKSIGGSLPADDFYYQG